jgi:hypothetical protein
MEPLRLIQQFVHLVLHYLAVASVADLNLDRALRRVGSEVERSDGVLELEAVCDERLEVDQPAGDEANRLRVLPRAERQFRALRALKGHAWFA